MAGPIAPVGRNTVQAAIAQAAETTGVDFSLLVQTAQRESGLNPSARAGTSSATGLFQFIDSTWLDMIRQHGAAHGLGGYAAALQSGQVSPQTRADILALRNDPQVAALMAGEFTRDNAAALQARLGRAPSAGELYAAHVFGAGGAAQLIEAAARGTDNIASVMPREASANRGLFYASNGEPRSAQGLLDRLDLDAGGSNDGLLQAVAAEPDRTGPLSPALAKALFTLSLLPLLRADGGDDDRKDPLQALLAYSRAQNS
ncbi:MAG: transglycosylase SLT domain-containing protein [Alphaproteobacteria bacterium]